MRGDPINELIRGAEAVSLFCRLNINTKRDLPVRSSEMGLLIYICESEDPVTSVMAAEFFKVKKPMVANMVSSLRRNGYLEKKPSQTDRRSFELLPTERAKLLVKETRSEYLKTMELLQSRLGDGYETLIALLVKANTVLLEEKGNG